ncbi:MAG: hypothetical protein KAJ63_06055 [Methyloprofundus sp.]|nr:hypothetical protein [Methyloprofundus sp.]
MKAISINSLKIISLLPCLFIVSCSYTSKPLYTSIPDIDNTPHIEAITQKTMPGSQRDQLVIHIPQQQPLPSDIVSFKTLQYRETNPSVVINVPVEMALAAKQEKLMQSEKYYDGQNIELKQLTSALARGGINNKEFELKKAELMNKSSAAAEFGRFNQQGDNFFRTAGYYNKAEQEIEKSLLRKGFNVLDRSKFEAQLRDLRDNSSRYDLRGRAQSTSINQYPEEVRSAMDILKKRLEKGNISTQEYMQEMKDLSSQKQRASGSSRQQNEMIDISEVIRAVQNGEAKADYLLQINEIKVVKSYDRQFTIADYPETQKFIEGHRGLKIGRGEGELPDSIPTPWYRAEFNAKLIHIKTGSIVWVGSHTVYSPAAEKAGISIYFDVEQYISNAAKISSIIDSYNRDVIEKTATVNELEKELNNLYLTASKTKKFDSEESKNNYERHLRAQISSLESKHRTAHSELSAMAKNEPIVAREEWDYRYRVSAPKVKPLLVEDINNLAMKEKVLEHKIKLIKEVTSALIGTIELNRM